MLHVLLRAVLRLKVAFLHMNATFSSTLAKKICHIRCQIECKNICRSHSPLLHTQSFYGDDDLPSRVPARLVDVLHHQPGTSPMFQGGIQWGPLWCDQRMSWEGWAGSRKFLWRTGGGLSLHHRG